MIRRGLIFIAWVTWLGWALGLCIPGSGLAKVRTASEYQIEAAFLYNFGRFVEWPEDVFARPTDPFRLCVIGDDPFGEDLETVVRDKRIGTREIVVQRVKSGATAESDLQRCQIAYVNSSERPRLKQIIDAFGKSSTLTVGDLADFNSMGGAIQFQLENGTIHFEINLDATDKARLRVSSKLLRLAKVMRGDQT